MKTTFKERSCLSQRELRQYLRGKMTKQQQHAVEHHLLDCPLCAHAVDGLEKAEAAGQLEQELSEAGALFKRAGRKVYRRTWMNWAAAAALIVLALFSVWQYRAATMHERLFVEYFSAAPPNYLALRSAQPGNALEGKEELQKALEFYRDGAFEASLAHLSLHLEAYPEDDQAYFLLANALLGARRSERAAHFFRQLQEDPPAGFTVEDIRWYLALALIEQEDTAAALQLLQELSASSYSEQALELRQALE
ncbi:MAG TPA: hypothetical protein VJ933_05725 [Phaeodactylibacter sp.]|nr:hypothetical protein [Phaeodactylibacter sp.]